MTDVFRQDQATTRKHVRLLLPHPMARARKNLNLMLSHLILIFVALVTIFPVWFSFIVSLSSSASTMGAIPLRLWPANPTFEAWQHLVEHTLLLRWFANSIIVSTVGALLNLLLCAPAAYALARFQFRGRNLIYRLIVSTLMVPLAVYLVPLYLVNLRLGWLNTYQTMFIPVSESVFGVFLLTQFFKSIPMELEDAAMIDGCTRFGSFYRIILPLAKPALLTLATFTFVWKWNMFLWPVIVIDRTDLYPLTVGIILNLGSYIGTVNVLMAGAIAGLVPVVLLFVIFQRQVVASVALSGLKG